MWLGLFKECMVSLIFLGINLLSLSITFFWSKLNILPAEKRRSTVIINHEDYLEKCMDHINDRPYQLLKRDPTTEIKTKTLK